MSVLLLHCPGDKIFLHDYYTSYSSKADYYWPPTDLILLSGILRGLDVSVLDAVAERMTEAECLTRIRDLSPEAIIFTTGTATWERDFAFTARLHALRPVRLIASGSIFVFEAERFLSAAPHVEAAITDITSLEIRDYLEGRAPSPQALAVRRNGTIIVPETKRLRGEFNIPTPQHGLFPFRVNRSPLARRLPFTIVVTSVGCPFGCVFCVAGAMAYRPRGLDGVLAELESLRDLGVREIMFNDPTFTVSKNRVKTICREMEARDLRFSWVGNAHITTLDDDLAAAMKKAGCHAVMIGVESGEDRILDAAGKKATHRQALDAFRICRRHKIRTLAYFIIGLPGETKETVEETIRFAKELDPDYASFTVLTPDVGSPLRTEAVARGLLDPGVVDFDSTGPPVFSAGSLSTTEIRDLRKKAVRAFHLRPSYILKHLARIRSFRELRSLVSNARSLFAG